MKRMVAFLGAGLCAAATLWAASGASFVAEMEADAAQLLASLAPEQRAAAVFPFEDEERFNWHFIPRARRGVPFKTMTPAQRQLAHAFLAGWLSHDGYRKAAGIMYLDQILYEQQNRNPIRDPEAYFFTFFNSPAAKGAWGWRFEGHHLSLNFTLRDGQVVSTTPSFFGANPAIVGEGPHRGLRMLAAEEELGRSLLRMLAPAQREKALLAAEAPADIVTGATRQADLGPPKGLAAAEMTAAQRAALWQLLEMYAQRLRRELAEAELAEIRAAGAEKIHFAWAGGSEPGQPHYYRIHGPTFVIEYDNTQNNANHIHTVWRDFRGDFGLDLLREHYQRSPHHQKP